MNDAQWTGRPMVEQCETHEFFEKDKLYTRRDNQNRDARLDPQFFCEAVFIHRSTRVLYAVGVFRSDSNRPWNAYPVQWTFQNWKEGWTEVELTGIYLTDEEMGQ